MGGLRWFWPVPLLALLILAPWACYLSRPDRPLSVVVLDKTVPYADFVEHRSLFEDSSVPLAGYVTARGWLEGAKLAPSEGAFYWRFYAPMMARMVGDLAGRRRGQALAPLGGTRGCTTANGGARAPSRCCCC